MKKIFVVKQETNDNGWSCGHHFYATAEEASQQMRDYVASLIMSCRSQGYKIGKLMCWRDDISGVDLPCGVITFYREKNYQRDYFDFRVFSVSYWEDYEERKSSSAYGF